MSEEGAGVNGILKGLRVVEGSAFVAAPLGGMTLAQMGADVIRFDPLGGGLDYRRWPVTPENESIYWAGMNKGKRSFAVNLRDAEGRELVAALITAPGPEAGIFLTNLQVGDWLSYETLSARRADLIMLRIIGNPDGTVAVDYTVNARMGWPYVTGPADLDEPVNNVLPGWDLTCGLTAAIGLLAAERHRSRTGEGQEVRLSLADVAYHITGSLGYIGDVEINGAERPRIGNDMYGTFGGDFATRDGRRVMLVVVTPRHVKALGQATGLTETFAAIETERGVNLADEADRWEVREPLRAALEPWFAAHSLEEVGARLTEAGVLWGPFRTHSQMVEEDPFCSTANPLVSAGRSAGDRAGAHAGLAARFRLCPARCRQAGATARPAYRRDFGGGVGPQRRCHRRAARSRHRRRAGVTRGSGTLDQYGLTPHLPDAFRLAPGRRCRTVVELDHRQLPVGPPAFLDRGRAAACQNPPGVGGAGEVGVGSAGPMADDEIEAAASARGAVAFEMDHVAGRRTLADGARLHISRRVVPRCGPRRAVELQQHQPPRRPPAGDDLVVAASHEEAPVEGLNRARRQRPVAGISLRIGHGHIGDHITWHGNGPQNGSGRRSGGARWW